MHSSGAPRRESEVVYLELRFAVIASAAKQSVFLFAAAMDCFAALAMTVLGLRCLKTESVICTGV